MSLEQEKKRSTILPISSEAEALRQAVLLSMRPNRRETIQQNENQEGMTTTISHPQQTDITQEDLTTAIQNDRYTTPPPRRFLRSEECTTPKNKILDTPAVLARERSFSPEEGEYVGSSDGDPDEEDSQRFMPRTNPFNIMQTVANGTNYERTAGNLLQRYFEESPGMSWVFNGTIVGRPPMEVNFDDDSDAEDDDVRTRVRRCYRVSTPCSRGEDLTPTNYILDYVETLEASQNNCSEDKMQIDSEEQANDNYIVSEKGDASPISPTTILNSPAGTVDEIAGNSSNNNCTKKAASEILSEVSPMRDGINQMCEIPSNTAHALGDAGDFNQMNDDPPNTAHANGDIQIAGGANQISDNFSPALAHSTGDVQMANQINNEFSPVLAHTNGDVQSAGEFNQMSDSFSPVIDHTTDVQRGGDFSQMSDVFPHVLAHSTDGTLFCNESDNACRLPDGIANRMNDISVREIGSPAEEGEIEEGEIVESEITFEEHIVQIKNADEETRELMKELYEEYGVQPFDIIEEGIPIDVVVRFTRELNHKLPPELEVFSVVTPNEQGSTQVNPVSPNIEPVIKLEPIEENLPIINNNFESSLASTMSVDRPFMTTREQNFIIDLSDSSDGEHRIDGLLQEVKSSLSGNEIQIDAKRKLEEKEREIKRMNELIASKTELLKKKSTTTTQQTSTLASPNAETSIDTIRAAIESFETTKSQVSEVKARLKEEEKRLENIRSEVAEIDIKIGKSSSLAKQYIEQIKNFDIQKDRMLQDSEEIERRIRTFQDELVKFKSQIDNIDKEKENAAIELATKEEEYSQQLRAREQNLEQERRVSENVAQFKKQLGPMLKDIKTKKEQLEQMVQSTKARNEPTMAESSTSVLNKNGKRRVIHEPEMIQEETPKKPKLALEVAELSKKIEQVSKEQQSLRESLEKKRQGDTETAMARKSKNSCSDNEWRAEKIASQEVITEDKSEVFRPYESPLKDFRSFRFHPEYVNVVRDVKSFTFNNHIVPNKKICAFELQPRGICNDDDCRSQHFRDLPMNENEVINELTGYYEGENFSQQRLYREGLHRLLSDLEMSGKDTFLEKFEEIKKYRDAFVARSQNDGTGALRVVFTNEHRPLADDWYISPPGCESESDYVSESLPTPRMPTSLSSGQDDDQQQIYPTSPELEDEDEDGDYFSPSSVPRHKGEDEKYESYGEEVEMGNESDDQFAELSESESADSEDENDYEGEEENADNQDVGVEAEEQERQQERYEQQAYAPFGYVNRFINWFL